MQIPLIDIFDTGERRIETTLSVPETNGSKDVAVNFNVPFGAGGSFCLATVLESAATQPDEAVFLIHDGYEGAQSTCIPIPWIRLLARSAMAALPRLVGKLDPSVTFVRNDPNCPF
jgi:hypothetical protein